MAKPSPSAEPSMEEILASIRRIISDDGAPATPVRPVPAAASPAPRPEVAPAGTHVTEDDLDRLFAKTGSETDAGPGPDEADVLDLTEVDRPGAEEPLQLVEGLKPDEAELTFVDPVAPAAAEADAMDWDEPAVEETPQPEPEPAPAPQAARAERRADPIRDPDREPLVSPQTGATVNAAFGQLTHTILSANARTLDDLVKEMLRPMLKGWLDENLPVIVERLVRAEIERVSRGR